MTGHTDSIPATITVVGPMIRRTADTAARAGEAAAWASIPGAGGPTPLTKPAWKTLSLDRWIWAGGQVRVRARGWTPNRQSTVLTGAMLSAVEVG